MERLEAERGRLTADLELSVAAFNVEKRALTEQEEDIEQSLDRLDREINRFLGQQTANNTQRNALRRQRDEEAASIQRRLRDLVHHHLSALNTAEAKMLHAMSLQPSLDVYSKPCTCACACACRNVFLCTCGRPCFCITHTVWFEVSLAGRPLGRLELALLGRTAPRTVENFFRRVVQPSSSAESYRGTPINWIKKNGWIAGGQLRSALDGLPLPSIYGGDLERESPRLRHYGPGWVHAWCNSGFRILLSREPGLDGQYVVFSRVTGGLAAVRQIAILEPSAGVPPQSVQIVDCGGHIVPEPLCLADLVDAKGH